MSWISTSRPPPPSPPPAFAWRSTRPGGASRWGRSTRLRGSSRRAAVPGCRCSSTRMRTSQRMWAGTSAGRRRTRRGWAILRWRRSRPGPAGWYRLREAQVSSTPHRLNRERFSQTAELFAANRAIERLSHLDALLHLVAPEPEDLLLDVACGPGRLLATFAPHVRMAVGLDLTLEMLRIARKLSVEGMASGTVVREFEEWCRVAGAPADVAARVRVALLDTRAGDLAGLAPVLVGEELRFRHTWMNIVCRRA